MINSLYGHFYLGKKIRKDSVKVIKWTKSKASTDRSRVKQIEKV